MNYYLGIHYGHNATIAVVHRGSVIFCQSEERLNRIKNSSGFPFQTLEKVYNEVCSPEEVSQATLFQEDIAGYLYLKSRNFSSGPYLGLLNPTSGSSDLFRSNKLKFFLSNLYYKIFIKNNFKIKNEALDFFSSALRISKDQIVFLNHHKAHAFSTIANLSREEPTLIFTLDGEGDGLSATVSISSPDGNLTRISEVKRENSLGLIYSMTTGLLGMKPNEHEFKVMGLAPYSSRTRAKPILDQLQKLIFIDDKGDFKVTTKFVHILKKLESIYRYRRFDDVAWAIQELTETLITKWITFWIQKTNIANVAVSGGVFMNVKACQKVSERLEVNRLFVMPSAGDESTAIGAAFYGSKSNEPDVQLTPLNSLYLGQEFHEEIEQLVIEERSKKAFEILRPHDIELAVAELLAEGHIVARFAGRMEFGARALGNRSILAHPSNFSNIDKINSAIKNRDFWMPFTPSIIEELEEQYIINPKKIIAPFMAITFNSTSLAHIHLVAAIHPRDKTIRPQIVTLRDNPSYHKIITLFMQRTGVGGILNTSFNLHGEPNVATPQDAIYTVLNSDLDYLAIGNYILKKKKSV